jgi:hypothetical protein
VGIAVAIGTRIGGCFFRRGEVEQSGRGAI